MVAINPGVIGGSGFSEPEESCLSIPEAVVKLVRRARIRVRALDQPERG